MFVNKGRVTLNKTFMLKNKNLSRRVNDLLRERNLKKLIMCMFPSMKWLLILVRSH